MLSHHIFFALEDTLIHHRIHVQAAQQEIEQIIDESLGGPSFFTKEFAMAERQNHEWLGVGLHSLFFTLSEVINRCSPHERVTDACREVVARLGRRLRDKPPLLIDGVDTTLTKLSEAGHCLHVLASGNEWEERDTLTRARLGSYFNHVHVWPDCTGERFDQLPVHLGLAPEDCTMVSGNLEHELVHAVRAGWKTIYIPTPNFWEEQSWHDSVIPISCQSLRNFSELQQELRVA